jgi:hypothetical protein
MHDGKQRRQFGALRDGTVALDLIGLYPGMTLRQFDPQALDLDFVYRNQFFGQVQTVKRLVELAFDAQVIGKGKGKGFHLGLGQVAAVSFR